MLKSLISYLNYCVYLKQSMITDEVTPSAAIKRYVTYQMLYQIEVLYSFTETALPMWNEIILFLSARINSAQFNQNLLRSEMRNCFRSSVLICSRTLLPNNFSINLALAFIAHWKRQKTENFLTKRRYDCMHPGNVARLSVPLGDACAPRCYFGLCVWTYNFAYFGLRIIEKKTRNAMDNKECIGRWFYSGCIMPTSASLKPNFKRHYIITRSRCSVLEIRDEMRCSLNVRRWKNLWTEHIVWAIDGMSSHSSARA